MTDEEIQKHKADIDKLSHEEMARLWRFSLAGRPYFRVGPVSAYFDKRFQELGGFTSEISKKIGWDNNGGDR